MNRTTTAVSAAVLGAALLLASCSSDSEGSSKTTDAKAETTTTAKPTETTEGTTETTAMSEERSAFCADVNTANGGYQPHIDDIFANGNDDPTLEEWAAFLPDQIEEMQAVVDRMSAVEPPADDEEIATAYQDVLDAFQAMVDNFDDGLTAAESGDQATFDETESNNQDTLTPALQDAFGTFGPLCGFDGN